MANRISQFLLLGLVASVTIFRPPVLRLFGFPVPVSDILFLFSAAAFAIAVARTEFHFRTDRSFGFLIAFAGSLLLSAIFSEDAGRSTDKLVGNLYLIAIAVLVFQHAANGQFIRKIVIAWLVGLAITIATVWVGLVLYAAGLNTYIENYFMFHPGTLPSARIPRMIGLFANPNMLCSYLAVTIPIVLAALQLGWISRKIGIFLAAQAALLVILTFSPGIGGVALAVGLWFIFANRDSLTRTLQVTLAGGVAVIAIGFFAAAVVAPDSVNNDRDTKIPGTSWVVEPSVRVMTWESAAVVVAEHPFIGRGTGLPTARVPYRPIAGPPQMLTDAHQMWLSVWAQAGTIGLIAFCLLLFHLFRRTCFRSCTNSTLRPLHIALSCGFLGGFIYQGLTGSFEDARHIWAVVGLLIAVSNVSKFDG
jgi:O-antigen ligase